jgi:hypothetical protein
MRKVNIPKGRSLGTSRSFAATARPREDCVGDVSQHASRELARVMHDNDEDEPR